jgi:hypothetical protein
MSVGSIATEVFAFIPNYENRKIDIYKDAKKASGNISEQMFYYTPLFSLVGDEEGKPTVTVDEKNVEILFQCYTEQLHDVVLTEVRARIGSNDLKSTQIGLIPLTQIEIEPESFGVASSIYPNTTGLSAISLSERYTARFQFSDEESAENFAKRVEEKREDFYVKFTIPSAGTVTDSIEISGSDFKKVDWKNFVNDKNAEENINAENPYFTIDQLSNNFSNILRRINITVITEGNPDTRQLTLDDKNKLLDLFIEDLTKTVVQDLDDFPPDEITDIFINKESFNADVIEKEKISTSESMTSAFESLIDKAEEDIKDDGKWSSRKSLLEQLKEAYRNKKGEGSLGTDADVKVFDIFNLSGSTDGTAKFDFTDNTRKLMRQESEESDFTHFKSATKETMRSELKNLLQKNSNFEWGFEGKKVVPKKIKLKRIISGEFKADTMLLQTTRTIQRSVTRSGFTIDSKTNLINLDKRMQKELDAIKAELESLKGQLASKADNLELKNVESNLSKTIGDVQSIASDAVSRADNAQNTANSALSTANAANENSVKEIKFFRTEARALTKHRTDSVDITFPERVDGIALESLLNDINDMSIGRIERLSGNTFRVHYHGVKSEGTLWNPSLSFTGIQVNK